MAVGAITVIRKRVLVSRQQWQPSFLAYVGFWHLADMPLSPCNVRFWGNSGQCPQGISHTRYPHGHLSLSADITPTNTVSDHF
jgi:hypothetical protein